MTSVPRPNPEHAPAANAVLTLGTAAAAEELRIARQAAAYRLQTWRLHQSNCQSCAEYPDAEYGGPGCGPGWRMWHRWSEAESFSAALGRLLDLEHPPQRSRAVLDELTLF